MKFRSFAGAFIAAIFLMASATVFAQTPTDSTADTVTPLPSDKTVAAKIEKARTFSIGTNHSFDTVTKKEDSTDAAITPIAKKAQTTSDEGWKFAFAPYLYLSGLSGTVGSGGKTLPLDLSIGDVLSHFKAGFMGTFEARKGRFIAANDLIWVKLTQENSTPGGLYNTAKVSVNMTIWNPVAGYRLVERKAGSFDITGGLRVTSVKTILSSTTGTLPGFSVEERKSWLAPVAGAHGIMNLSEKVYLSALFDVGAGFGTDLTAQFYGGIGYRINPKFALVGGYRYLKNDYKDEGFVWDTTMNGLVMGAKFTF